MKTKVTCDRFGLRASDQVLTTNDRRNETRHAGAFLIGELERLLDSQRPSLAETIRAEYAALAKLNERNREFWGGAR